MCSEMQKFCTATCTILARLLPGLVRNSWTDTIEFWQATRRSLRWSFDCTSSHVAEIQSRYRNSRPSPTVFSGYTVEPESSGLYIGGAFRPRVEPAGLPKGVARPEHVLVRPDVVHWTQPGSLSDSRTGAHIQAVTWRAQPVGPWPCGSLRPRRPAPLPLLTPVLL